jgi:uncharacterized protein YajQ (UPF0234 family)
MSKEFSFDVVCEFDFQELRNAVDQVEREAKTRYDLKNSEIEIDLKDDQIEVKAGNAMEIAAVEGILLQKMVNRKVSPKTLDHQEIEAIGGSRSKKVYKLIKSLDSENAKKISKLIKERVPKVKASIQGEAVRISGKAKDDLQEAIGVLSEEEVLDLPLSFTNYR